MARQGRVWGWDRDGPGWRGRIRRDEGSLHQNTPAIEAGSSSAGSNTLSLIVTVPGGDRRIAVDTVTRSRRVSRAEPSRAEQRQAG